MIGIVFADLTNCRLLRSLTGGTFTWPKLQQGGVIGIGLRLAEQIDGRMVEKTAEVVGMSLTIGSVDTAPTGEVRIKVGNGAAVEGTNLTAPIDISSTDAQFASALNALTVVGTTYGAASVTLDNGSPIIVFDGEVDQVPLAVQDVSLSPIGFGRVYAWEVDGEWRHAIRFQVAPVVFSDAMVTKVPPPPTITRVQTGATIDFVEINEIQKLTVPAAFRGSFQLSRSSIPTGLLDQTDDEETIAVKLQDLADEGGEFAVSAGPIAGTAYIEFAGEMGGTPQDLLDVSVFDAPAGDPWIFVAVDSAVLAELFRVEDTDELKLPMEIILQIEGDDEIVRPFPVFRGEVTILERVNQDDLATSVDVSYVRSPYGRDYTPFTASQLTTGNQAYAYVFGNGADTVFAPVHNLHSDAVGVMVRENVAGGAQLILGTDFSIVFDNDDSATITLLGTYASSPPASNALLALFVDYNQTSAFDVHTHTIPQVALLTETIAELSGRLAALEALAPGAVSPLIGSSSATRLEYPMPQVWKVLPSRTTPKAPASLLEFDPVEAGIRFGSLLPAVHDAVTEELPATLPTPSAELIGHVYEVMADRDDIPGGVREGDFVACDGTVWYRVEKYYGTENSFYPSDFEVLLFDETISEYDLTIGSALSLVVGFEAAIFTGTRRRRDRRGEAQWTFVLEFGTAVATSTPSPTGENVESYDWGDPVIEHTFNVTDSPRPHRFGITLSRSLVDAEDTLALDKTIERGTTSGTPPASPNCKIRGRLIRFDLAESTIDPTGLVAVRGLDVSLGSASDESVGKIVIQ